MSCLVRSIHLFIGRPRGCRSSGLRCNARPVCRPYSIYSVFVRLSFSFSRSFHCCTWSLRVWRSSFASRTSSAYRSGCVDWISAVDVSILRMNRKGERADPWWTPTLTRRRDSHRVADYADSVLVEELGPSDIGLRDLMWSKGIPDQIVGDPIKRLLQVQERHVDFFISINWSRFSIWTIMSNSMNQEMMYDLWPMRPN